MQTNEPNITEQQNDSLTNPLIQLTNSL